MPREGRKHGVYRPHIDKDGYQVIPATVKAVESEATPFLNIERWLKECWAENFVLTKSFII